MHTDTNKIILGKLDKQKQFVERQLAILEESPEWNGIQIKRHDELLTV